MSTDGTTNEIHYREFFAALMAPIDPAHVRERSQAGRTFSYITARTAMNRLDEVAGPAGWRDEYTETKEGLKCRLWIQLPDGQWTWKEDGGGFAGMAETDNDEKSAFSDAFKRAAAKWGVARGLYKDGMPSFVVPGFSNPVPRREPTPAREGSRREPDRATAERPAQGERKPYDGPDRPPTSGRALFAWVRKQEGEHGDGLLKHLNAEAKLRGYPGKMVDFNPEEVADIYAEALRAIQDKAGVPVDHAETGAY